MVAKGKDPVRYSLSQFQRHRLTSKLIYSGWDVHNPSPFERGIPNTSAGKSRHDHGRRRITEEPAGPESGSKVRQPRNWAPAGPVWLNPERDTGALRTRDAA